MCSEFEGLVFEKEDSDAKSKKLTKGRKLSDDFKRASPSNGEAPQGLGLPVAGTPRGRVNRKSASRR